MLFTYLRLDAYVKSSNQQHNTTRALLPVSGCSHQTPASFRGLASSAAKQREESLGGTGTSDMNEGEVFHEKQRLELCAIHALNNVLQERVFTKETADDICKRLAPQCVVNPHRSVLGTGNYDVNVIMAALQSRELAAVWWDKRRTIQSLCMSKVQGFILNVPSRVSLGIVSLPLRRRHWLAVRQVSGQYYNLDSKLKSPVCIGGEAELCTFLSEQLSQDVAEMLLVVQREVEEDGSWLNSDNLEK
ncbi:josephin-2 isoform X2 [Nothobranchius furzeri]|uniref:Josephin-2 n=5 Tax=Nothobranchius TaxID=28779 RepID=A0A9D2YWH6_NOTFU|nr:josephin-2 isoform X2 [Nothobranchius furzeri]KAF7227148.1 transcript variant X2 [Nothobranchius furzeri]